MSLVGTPGPALLSKITSDEVCTVLKILNNINGYFNNNNNNNNDNYTHNNIQIHIH